MHPRLIACLVPTIAAAAAGAVWTLMAGWGWLAALLVYSFGGALALIGFSALAVLLEPRDDEAPTDARHPSPMPARAVAMAGQPNGGHLL
jgi:fatty acid desaturase